MEFFQQVHRSLLQGSKDTIQRELMNNIDWNQRLICIKGFRSVGKTTFLLDYIKTHYPNSNDVLYLNLNNFYFTKRKISSFADEFAKRGGKLLLLDQIQKYPDWSADLRKCLDEIPDLKIIFTSSPVLRITEDNPDLEGIASIYHLEGLSFREYLNHQTGSKFTTYTLEEILNNHIEIAQEIVDEIRPLAYFDDYLRHGYFPYYIHDPNFYIDKLLKNINLALEIDVPYINQIEFKYLPKLRKLLHIIASETPFTPNVSKLASSVETSRATIMNYLKYLKNARLINLLYENGGSDDDQMKKPDKVYMHNTNLLNAIAPNNFDKATVRQTFFYNQVGYVCKLAKSPVADFCVNEKYKFNVGGRKLEPKKGIYAASDVIEVGEGNKIPLWLFGFLY
ncbi:ATP-binding protein [Draconibacterium halophilum]|uniref:AAA family ATPase n=1 Tax=Draconibacterium halophilum TaxID=2706887 RepID=A0A6C0RBR2_9BACT|nr:AAA family ATPase [Draconibacterium halophilum]QIA07760.1 AAA family ATPase [Draconibacterium halophilum]